MMRKHHMLFGYKRDNIQFNEMDFFFVYRLMIHTEKRNERMHFQYNSSTYLMADSLALDFAHSRTKTSDEVIFQLHISFTFP